MTYEGARSITGPYLAFLGASGTVVGIVAGFGELIGYALRIVSGFISDRTGKYWTVTLIGYFVKYRDQTIVLTGHTVVNRIILLCVLGLGNDHFWRLRQDTCAINVFEVEGGVFTILRLDDICHLRSKI
jgi:hypothetical protein